MNSLEKFNKVIHFGLRLFHSSFLFPNHSIETKKYTPMQNKSYGKQKTKKTYQYILVCLKKNKLSITLSNIYSISLNFYEYFLFIQEVQEKPANGYKCDTIQELCPIFRKLFDQSTKKEIGCKSEVDHLLSCIHGY